MKILVIRFSSVGDIVLTTPVIRVLRSQDWEVHYATRSAHEDILKANPYIDKIHLLDDSINSLAADLKKENFDCIVDLQKSFQTRILKVKLKKKTYSYQKLRFRKWLMVRFKLNLLPNIHVVDRFLKAVEPLGVGNDSLGLDYFIPERDQIENDWLPETHRNGFVVLAIKASHKTRQLPAGKLIELCDRINKPVIVMGDQEDENTGDELVNFFRPGSSEEEKEIESLNKKTIIFNACGKFSTNQAASVISNAICVFSYDNEMLYISSALKKQVYSIWGNTIPAFGNYPYRTRFTIFENNKLSCRPCSQSGFEKCPKGHFKCMNDLIFDFYLPD